MTASQNHKYNQLKWLYSALSGFCAAYFLSLFSSSQSIEQSLSLFISTLLFSVCLPIFTAFAIAHVYMAESNLTVEQCDRVLNLKWVTWFTISAFTLLYLAFWFLTAFFSLWVMGLFTTASVTCFFIFGIFIRRLHALSVADS